MKRDTLIQKTQRVAHGAVRSLCDIAQRFLLYLNLFRRDQLLQPSGNSVDGYPPEIISLTPGQDRDRKLMHLRRGKDKDHI